MTSLFIVQREGDPVKFTPEQEYYWTYRITALAYADHYHSLSAARMAIQQIKPEGRAALSIAAYNLKLITVVPYEE